jgi:hypothetical protein
MSMLSLAFTRAVVGMKPPFSAKESSGDGEESDFGDFTSLYQAVKDIFKTAFPTV